MGTFSELKNGIQVMTVIGVVSGYPGIRVSDNVE